jgi:spermidine synthase
MADERKTPGYSLDAAVFVCGAVVMIYEIIGSRVVSPFIGTSTYVWTSLIGVILGALSLGYWLGGRFADRKPSINILASAIFLAGGFVAVTILCKEIILSFTSTAGVGLEIKSVIAAVLLFAPASVALGFVTPYAVKLKLASLSESGSTVGRLYALSTIGSIVGTFTAGFYLVPFVGSMRSLYLLAAVLFVVSVSLAAVSITRTKIALLTLFFIAITLSEINTFYLAHTRGLHDIDTEYSRVQIFQTTEPKSGRAVQAMAIDPYFVQSAVFLDSDELVFDYNKYYHLVRQLKPDFQRTLMIGGAGYTFPRNYLQTYPSATIDVVEIDPQMTAIAREYFRLKDDPRLNIIHADGRTFLNQAPDASYDAVLMDAFGSLFSVPYQLTTIEAVRQIHRVLKPDGVVIFNLGSALSGPASRFLQAEFRTYQSDFPHVYLFKVNPDYTDDQLQNLIITACKSDCLRNETSDPQITNLLTHQYPTDFPLGEPPLTDDLAPVEHYNSTALNLYRRSEQ